MKGFASVFILLTFIGSLVFAAPARVGVRVNPGINRGVNVAPGVQSRAIPPRTYRQNTIQENNTVVRPGVRGVTVQPGTKIIVAPPQN